MRWLRRLLGDDAPDPGLSAPVPPPPAPYPRSQRDAIGTGWACRWPIPDSTGRTKRGELQRCGLPKAPGQPTCRKRASCRAGFEAAYDAAMKLEERRRAKAAEERPVGRVVRMRRAR